MSGPLEVSVLPGCDLAADRELDRFFEDCPGSFAQQTTGWRDVIRGLGCDEPLYLTCHEAGTLVGVLPAYRFEGPLGAILTSAAQAGPLGGIACRPEADAPSVYAALLEAFRELAAARGCALASAITNPFWPDRELYEGLLEPDFVLENRSQVLDLESAFDAEGRFVSGSAAVRRNLRRAEASGLQVDEQQSAANVDQWYALHCERQRELGATPLPRALVAGALQHMVPRDKARFFFVRSASGELIAGGLYLYHGTVIDALMPAIRSEHARLGPGFLLAMHSIRWARERGLRHYNWQASPPGGGVYRFKQGWGSRDVDYAYVTRITGDAEPFLNSEVEKIQAGYPWHYVLPFDRVGQSGARGSGPSSRATAWRAQEESRR